MKRLRLGAVLHFIIAIGHLGCLFALDEAFDAYGIKDVMHNMVSGHVWMLSALYRRDDHRTVILRPGCMDDFLHRPLRRHTGRAFNS